MALATRRRSCGRSGTWKRAQESRTRPQARRPQPARTPETARAGPGSVPDEPQCARLVVADAVIVAAPQRLLFCVGAWDKQGGTARDAATRLWRIENNLSLANMDFDEFADTAEKPAYCSAVSEGAAAERPPGNR
ncbi:DUF6924 domain-containing protein [Streptomyces netropsis]